MLTEHCIVAVGATINRADSNAVRNASILTLELQPTRARRSAELKKSTTAPNCLAISPSHIYAAQSDKAIVNVYNREKGSLEAAVPFKKKVTCLALACHGTLLVMGNEQGRLHLWETHTGRELSTTQAHLQPISAIAIDPTSDFILTGSLDATVHVWSLPALVSFLPPPTGPEEHSRHAPLKTLSSHRDAITSITLGHSASFCNFAISTGRDNTAIIWDYHSETILRTILLPDAPISSALDPADRALYIGFENGSIQTADLMPPSSQHHVADTTGPAAGSTVQPDPASRWIPPVSDAVGAALTLLVSYDGTRLVSGHQAGKILLWDIPTGTYISNLTLPPLSGPVTNILPLPVSGFPDSSRPRSRSRDPANAAFKQVAVVKPRFGDYDLDGSSSVPENYTLSLQYTSTASGELERDFQDALTHPCFPPDLLQDCVHELATWSGSTTGASAPSGPAPSEAEGFIPLDVEAPPTTTTSSTSSDPSSSRRGNGREERSTADEASRQQDVQALRKENERLKRYLASARRVTQRCLEQVDALSRPRRPDGAGGEATGSRVGRVGDGDRGGGALGHRGPRAKREPTAARARPSSEAEGGWDRLAD